MLLILNIFKIKVKKFNMNYKVLRILEFFVYFVYFNFMVFFDLVVRFCMVGVCEGYLYVNFFFF